MTRKDLEDRMESFFLSETCKYLYLVSLSISHTLGTLSHQTSTGQNNLFSVMGRYQKYVDRDAAQVKNVMIPGFRKRCFFLVHPPHSDRPLTRSETHEPKTKIWQFPHNEIAIKVPKYIKIWINMCNLLRFKVCF